MDEPIHQDHKQWDRYARSKITIDVQTTARYVDPSQGKEKEITVWISDISEGGIGLLTKRFEIPIGAEVHATFQLPIVEAVFPLTFNGIVRRSQAVTDNKYEAGVEFINLSKEDRLTIRKFISSQEVNEMF